jgi:hypothetical protein
MMRLRLCQERLAGRNSWNYREGDWNIRQTKKIGAESSDPNRHSQPRLPGSVVGDASMRRAGFADKITEVSVLK